MLYLFEKNGAALGEVAAFDSIVTTERYREHSEWSGRFPATVYPQLNAAYFANVRGEDEVYLVENLELVSGADEHCKVERARSATALLHTRTIAGSKSWTDQKAGYMISNMMADLTGSRALPLVFGTGDTVGGAFSLQRSWGDMGDIALEILAAQGLGMRARLDGATVKLDVFGPTNMLDIALGEKHRDGSFGRLKRDDRSWFNFAYVLGEGEGAAREQVTVDQTAGNERRELYVDARDLAKGTLTTAQYQAQLSARGTAKLSETRRVYAANAEGVERADLKTGDVVQYDSKQWSEVFTVMEMSRVYENGKRSKVRPTFGDPPPKLPQTIRRLTK